MTIIIEVVPVPANLGHWHQLMLESHAEEGKGHTEVGREWHGCHKPQHMLPKWVMAIQLDYSLFFKHVPHCLFLLFAQVFSSIFSNFSPLNFQPFYKTQLKPLSFIKTLNYLLHLPLGNFFSLNFSLLVIFFWCTPKSMCGS